LSTATQETRTESDVRRGMLHYEHPERIGEAFCGAPVVGVRGHFGRVECVVCVDLMREHKRTQRRRR